MAIAIPELYCPFSAPANPAADLVQRRSLAWAERLGLVGGEAGWRRLTASRIAWLVARAWPEAAPERLQLAADWTTFFCLLDDRVERLAPMPLGGYLSQLQRVLRGELQPEGDPAAGALADLRGRLLACADEAWLERFAERVEELFTGFAWEAIHRKMRVSPELASYQPLREVTVGLHPLFRIGELLEELPSPEILADPALQGMASCAARAVGWANDVFTCERELAEGEVHNLVMVLMRERGAPLEEALGSAAAAHDEEVRAFQRLEARRPRFGAAEPAVERYCAMLRAWMRGHLDWARETGRYKPSPAASVRPASREAEVTAA